MNNNYRLQSSSPRFLSAICLLVFLVVNFSVAKTQSGVGETTSRANSPAVHANGKIAFTSDRDGNQEIYVMNSDGSGQWRLTNNPGTDSSPTFSPDGRTIAFVSENASHSFAIKLMNADGTNQIVLTPIVWDNYPYPWHHKFSLSWSPDGTKIAFQESGEIFTVNVDGSNRVNLTKHPASDIEPSWSPDGSRILFVSSRVFYLTLHTMNADGSDVRDLPGDGEFWDMSPDWSPTGNKIAFVVHSDLTLPTIYTAHADGSNRQVFDGCSSGLCSTHRNKPRWSPDLTKVVFSQWEYFTNDSEIYVKNVNGDAVTQLTNTNGNNFQPSWALAPVASPTCPNPIDCSEFFVRQHYLDFLNREPDPAGDAAWQAVINGCAQGDITCDRIHVSSSFFRSPEFQGRGYFVYRFYPVAFGRKPDYDEFSPDVAKVGGFLSDAELEAAKAAFITEFMSRPAFVAKFSGLDNAAYVDTLLTTAGITHWARGLYIAALGNGTRTRAQVLREISESTEVFNKYYNQAFVVMQYFGYLRRQPDALYLNWIAHIDATGDYRSMIDGFVSSAEYRARFGP